MARDVSNKLSGEQRRKLLDAESQTTKAPLAKNVVVARKARGWTQEELAARSGVSRTTIAMIEGANASHGPSLETLTHLATSLGVSPVMLLMGDRELQAVIEIAQTTPKKLLEHEISDESVEEMRRLIHSGMQKNLFRAVKIGVATAAGAGLVAGGGVVGSSIGSVLFPGLGTIVGAVLGTLISPARQHTAKK